jgi:NAD(P)H-dependent flavin oxidoreductase YrpB (nitropropane dioxygenase family)
VGANMAGASGGALAAEVSLAGGFGFIAIGMCICVAGLSSRLTRVTHDRRL